MSASEFDQLLSQDGILMAGRFGPGWTVTDHKCKGLNAQLGLGTASRALSVPGTMPPAATASTPWANAAVGKAS